MFCQAPLDPAKKRFVFTPEQALRYSEDFLRQIWTQVLKARSDLAGRIEVVVSIGHPVHWSKSARLLYAEMLSRVLAPYKVELIPEPAAALYHAFDSSEVPLPAKVLVIDFGAGTTDFCVSDVAADPGNKNKLRLVNPEYYGEDYGGSNFDQLLMEYASYELKVDPGEELGREWLNITKKWKELLSSSLEQPGTHQVVERFPLPTSQIMKPVRLDRETFETVCAPLINRFGIAVESAIGNCHIDLPQIEE